jgi:hypothetical protein
MGNSIEAVGSITNLAYRNQYTGSLQPVIRFLRCVRP